LKDAAGVPVEGRHEPDADSREVRRDGHGR
jgi:hypothetical protein